MRLKLGGGNTRQHETHTLTLPLLASRMAELMRLCRKGSVLSASLPPLITRPLPERMASADTWRAARVSVAAQRRKDEGRKERLLSPKRIRGHVDTQTKR